MSTIDIVRRIVGRRHKITRAEMRDILNALAADGLHLGNDCMQGTWEFGDAGVAVGPSPDAGRVWANACTGINVISVMARGCTPHGSVRYDQPGSMAPMMRAEIMFSPEGLDAEYLRTKATRLLIVLDGDPLPDPTAAPETELSGAPNWVQRLRRRDRCDGTWCRIHDDGTLEMRYPNDGQSSDPDDKSRHQYRIDAHGLVLSRRLPPASVGDAWLDIGVPEWEPSTTPPRDEFAREWWEEQVM